MRLKSNNILILLLIIAGVACDSQNNIDPRDEQYFIKYFGESGDQFGSQLIATDNGFVIVGTSRQRGEDSQIYIAGADQKGNQLWSNTFGRTGTDDTGIGIVESSGGLVLVGNSVNEQGFSDILVYNLSTIGEKIDSTIVENPSFNNEASDVIVTQSGNILIAGYTSDVLENGGTYDFYFPQLLPDLTMVDSWPSRYGFGGEDKAAGVREKASGEFVFIGITDKPEQVDTDKAQTNMIMFQITADDGIPNIAVETYGSTNEEVANGIATLSDGGHLFVGSTSDGNNSDIFISRIRQNSELIGTYTINKIQSLTGTSILEAQGGGFIVLGDISTPTGTNIYMTKTDNSGRENWKRTFGFSGINTAGGVLQLQDGSIVFTGSVNLDSQSKICLIKTNENGDLELL